jgi:hypothetical protein
MTRTKERLLELVRMEDALLEKMRREWAEDEEAWQRAEHTRKVEEAVSKLQYYQW